MKVRSLLLSALFAFTALSASALSLSLQYPFGANQVMISQENGVITLNILAPEEDEFADPYVATAPLGLVLAPESKSITFEYTSTAPFKVTKVWYAPDGGQFYAEPDFEAETSMDAADNWKPGSFSIAAGVEALGFGMNKNDWMRIDFEVEPGTVIKLRNLQIPGTEDPMQASFGFPLYTQHLTPGKHTLRVYSLAQKWYFDYIRIEGLGEPSGNKTGIDTVENSLGSAQQVYTLNGMLVGCTTDGLKPGVYVVKNGQAAKKYMVK